MDYGRLANAVVKGVTAYSATGGAMSVVCGRVSYTFKLKGAAVSVDTACSSSLVSLHFALNSLWAGQSLRALNSGVNLTLMPETPAMFQRAGMMSPEGRCKTLDASADGYVRGEAVVTALLQAVAAYEATNASASALCAVLQGTAVNQGGRSSTLTAPNGPSQQDVIRNALNDATQTAAATTSLQMHGTGECDKSSSLRDPLLSSLVNV